MKVAISKRADQVFYGNLREPGDAWGRRLRGEGESERTGDIDQVYHRFDTGARLGVFFAAPTHLALSPSHSAQFSHVYVRSLLALLFICLGYPTYSSYFIEISLF